MKFSLIKKQIQNKNQLTTQFDEFFIYLTQKLNISKQHTWKPTKRHFNKFKKVAIDVVMAP